MRAYDSFYSQSIYYPDHHWSDFWLLSLGFAERGEVRAIMNAPLGLKIFVVAVVLSVLLTVGYGIYVVGAPTTQRLVRLDQQRVSDLQNISFAISSYWDRNKELPPSLEALQEPQYFVQAIQDPETSQPYEYHILNEDTYEPIPKFVI